jgi:hypothetical protein
MLQRTLPAGFIAPCLPTKTDKLPSGSQWLHEIKHDGFRIIARKSGGRVRLVARARWFRLTNERDFPYVVELALPLGPFRSVFLEIDAFHRERRIPSPPRPESTQGQASLYSILLPRDRYGGCISQSLRWRVLDPHTSQVQAADLGCVVG